MIDFIDAQILYGFQFFVLNSHVYSFLPIAIVSSNNLAYSIDTRVIQKNVLSSQHHQVSLIYLSMLRVQVNIQYLSKFLKDAL